MVEPSRAGRPTSVPASLTDDQIREINAKTHVMNELIDDACGRVLATRRRRAAGGDDTDVFFTTDHGELQGDFGLLFKGPFHTDALMRLPLVWRPAPSAAVAAGVRSPSRSASSTWPPTFCAIAGVPGARVDAGHAPADRRPESGRERVLCEWDSQFPGYGMHLRIDLPRRLAVHRVRASTERPAQRPREGPDHDVRLGVLGQASGVSYDGTEGELYDVDEDPHQLRNLWDDPARKALRADLVADLYDSLPAGRPDPLEVVAPA